MRVVGRIRESERLHITGGIFGMEFTGLLIRKDGHWKLVSGGRRVRLLTCFILIIHEFLPPFPHPYLVFSFVPIHLDLSHSTVRV